MINIFYIDDSIGECILLRKKLESAAPGRYQLSSALSFAKATEDLVHNAPDVVLLDHSLPGSLAFQGLDTIQRLLPSTPVIIYSGYADEAVAAEYIHRGAALFLRKDIVSGAELDAAIYDTVQKKWGQKQV